MSKAVIVPMAGKGERFSAAGFVGPKWAINPPWTKRSLLEVSVAKIVEAVPRADLLLITLDVAYDCESLRTALGPALHPAGVAALKETQPGPLASVAAAWASLRLDDYDELWFTTCDTYVPPFVYEARLAAAGTVVCFDFDAPNLCHVDADQHGKVLTLREKVGEMTSMSSTGTFRINCVEKFRCAMLHVLALPSVRASGEYFISDAINLLISQRHRFDTLIVPGATALGTPEELNNCPKSIADSMKQ